MSERMSRRDRCDYIIGGSDLKVNRKRSNSDDDDKNMNSADGDA